LRPLRAFPLFGTWLPGNGRAEKNAQRALLTVQLFETPPDGVRVEVVDELRRIERRGLDRRCHAPILWDAGRELQTGYYVDTTRLLQAPKLDSMRCFLWIAATEQAEKR
jgi:hypothetical protein